MITKQIFVLGVIMNNNSLNNGVIPYQLIQRHQHNSTFGTNKKVPDNLVIMNRNWALHRHYIRHQYQISASMIRKELIRSNERNEYATYIMGILYRKEGKIQESLYYFQKSYHMNSTKLSNVKQIAKSLFLLGNHAHAINIYSEALRIPNLSNWRVYYNIGECYLALHHIESAERNLIKSTELTSHVTPHVTLARIYIFKDELSKAIATYKSALITCTIQNEVIAKLGLLYLKMNDVLKAFHEFGKILSQDSVTSRAMLAVAYIIQIHREPEIAISKFKVAAQSFPESFHLWNNIGVCLYEKRKFLAAISCLKRAHYFHPTTLSTACILGKVLIITNQFASAAIYLCSAVTGGTKNYIPFLLLSYALAALDDLEGAEQIIYKAHSIAPQNPAVLVNYAIILEARNNYEHAFAILSQLNDISTITSVELQITKAAHLLSRKMKKKSLH
ncbi:Bardet-Biedl syndrome 4 protein isoform X2 [Microplitis mediator]|uniref:Bardet-Biedl syndrome 4 protein isoform X2 n=1 Tax=Microplitis mediator TaxID=375433 RepID=UPI0025569ECB|nr:Bardet-Biedl syndrome 4 protein isoform X2 [Microplitis mediator]